jgi:hypothetical protein
MKKNPCFYIAKQTKTANILTFTVIFTKQISLLVINKLEQRVKEIERSNEILCKQSTMFNNDTANSNAQ